VAKLDLGLVVGLAHGPDAALEKVRRFGLPTCQLVCWDPRRYSRSNARAVREASARTGVRVSALWAGYRGPLVWNLVRGPETIGLPPERWREARVRALRKGAEFAREIGAPAIITHAGFIPERPNDPRYKATVRALRQVARHCRKLGIEFWFESGQETPVTLRRAIEDVGTDNLGINLDPANLILYGKANPVDALDVFGRYVRGLHAKDGLYPTDPRRLGKEVPLGSGKVDFPKLIPALYRLGFRGAVTVEREIAGPRQARDIRKAITYLNGIIAGL